MSATKLVFTIQKPSRDCWIATLSDGVQEAIITASSVPEPPLVPLLWAVRLLLMGASDAKCSWWNEPGEYRWLFTRQREQVVIHILWFRDIAGWSDEKGECVVRIVCDLHPFAKRLLHQLSQLQYRDGDLTVPLNEYHKLQEAIQAFAQTNYGLQA